jgi:formylglycine-generating enzyme required for sulfatase activity
MIRYIWIGILTISLNCVFAQKYLKRFYIDIEDTKKSFILKNEVSIDDYCFFLYMIEQEQGEDTEQYKSLIPDTVKFREHYGFPFSFLSLSSYQITALYRTLPMVAISYKQALSYCQWVEDRMNQSSKSPIYQCSLPEKADYEKALKKAKITKNDFLSPLQIEYKEKIRKRKDIELSIIKPYPGSSIYGLTDNVAEYTQDGFIVVGGVNSELKFNEIVDTSTPTGFRVKTTIISKK